MSAASPAFLPAVFRTLARLPMPLMQGVGAALGWLVWFASPRYRARLAENARRAGVPRAAWRPAIGAAGRMAAELPWLWLRPADEGVSARVTWTNDAAFDAALVEGHGVVLVTPHVGSWEMCGQALAERWGRGPRGPFVALFRPPRKAWLVALVASSRERPGFRTVPTTLAGVRDLIRALRAGGFTGILPDQVPPAGQGAWAPFFGRPAYTMTLVARLAQQTGARVMLCWCERTPGADRPYTIRFEALDAPEFERGSSATPEAAAAALNAGLERVILGCPGQYLWSYNRYKSPREEP